MILLRYSHQTCFLWFLLALQPSMGLAFSSSSTESTFHVVNGPQKVVRLPNDPLHSKLPSQFHRNRQNFHPLPSFNQHDWDGDDLRWLSRWRRRLSRSVFSPQPQPWRNALVLVNILAYSYQVFNTLAWLAQIFPGHWPRDALTMVLDTLLGRTAASPLTRDFWFLPALASLQPHRYLTAGFLHGSLLHLVVNLDALLRLPGWLETGLGAGLFVTTFLVAVVAGNVGHAQLTPSANIACLGASGGICGLYGLMYACLVKMGNDRAASQVLRGMTRTLIAGFLLTSISNAAHAAGFLAGIVMGILCGPSYRRSYSARRKWSSAVDLHGRDYRAAMGFGVEPTSRGRIPVGALWAVALLYVVSHPNVRLAPKLIGSGILQPGSVTPRFYQQ